MFTGPDDRDEPLANNAFSDANEWTGRRVAKTGADKDEYAYTYDAVGNLTREDVTIVRGVLTANTRRGFVYDVFGRLVASTGLVTEDGPTPVSVYRYNGLGMRISWQDDFDADGTLEASERFDIVNDERWRPVGTFRDADAHPKEAFVFHSAG